MKQFFKFMLASMVGFFLTIILGLIILIAIGSSVVGSFDKKESHIGKNTVLEINLGLEITDRTIQDPFMDFVNEDNGGESAGLDRIVRSIQVAKDAEEIEGIYLNMSFVGAGYATLEEIRNALVDFKESGKFIYAYSEFYYEPSYYLASVADSIFLNPSGTFLFNGISSQTTFMKDMLDKLGVDVQVIKVGKFKGATEAFSEKQLSDNNRHQIEVFINSIYDNYLANVSSSRGIPVDTLKAIANGLRINITSDALHANLIDGLAFEDEARDAIKRKLKLGKDEDLKLAKVNKLYKSNLNRPNYSKRDRIAVVYATGEIGSGNGDEYNIGSKSLTKALRQARNDKRVKAIVLRVNSPGGSALASDVIFREAELCAKEKPLIVSMGDLAASGGYFISTAADTIVAEPTTITGSIGVFMLLPNMQKLLNEKIGLHYESVNTTKYADIGRVDRPLTEKERKFFQNMVDKIYSDFLDRVSTGRNITKEQVDSIGQGRVWTGSSAKEIGLVDVLGGLEDAISIAANKAGIKEYRVKSYPKMSNPIERMFKSFSPEVLILKKHLGSNYKYFTTLERLSKMEGAQMRMQYEIKLD